MTLTIALAGNPNTGKSTIFNALTGSRQHVGNWSGKTVEKKAGSLRLGQEDICIVDLPGTYSLTAYSVEEAIARDFLITDTPDAVIAVADANNLERNLYLVVQLMEMGCPLILALNMMDVADSRGIEINTDALSTALGNIPVVRMIGSRAVGLDTLKNALIHKPAHAQVVIPFDEALEAEIYQLEQMIAQAEPLRQYPTRWLAIKLLENDAPLLALLTPHQQAQVQTAIERLMAATGEEPEILIADGRYSFISAVIQAAMHRPQEQVVTRSDKLDMILTHRYFGLPIFLLLMWLVFQFTAYVSVPYQDWIDTTMTGFVTAQTLHLMDGLGMAGSWLEALLIDGVITGVGGVLVFLPVLTCLYIAIAILEDSGYMARAAFVMDKLMQALGLHGKSFLPLLIGFGCSVPGIYATRTLENETDRKITGFLVTFMSCSARLPVYVVFGAAFFGGAAGNLIFGLYLTGIGIAILTSILLTKIIYKNKLVPPFVLELPPYHVPHFRTVFRSTRERSAGFVRKAGTLILSMSIIIWLLMAIPLRGGSFNNVAPENSILGTFSSAIAPIFAPAGFDNWQASSALVTGFVAKEVVVSTLSQIYVGGVDEDAPPSEDSVSDVAVGFGNAAILTVQELLNILPRTLNMLPGVDVPVANFLHQDTAVETDSALENGLQNAFTPLQAVAFNVFILLYVPCVTAVAAMRHEFGTRWMLIQAGYALLIAWLAAVIMYQIGRVLGF